MAYLSDDLPAAEHARVEGHLALCWPCNERRLALQEKMQQIQEVAEEEGALGREQVERARSEFFTRFAALEAELEAERVPAFRMLSRAWEAAFAAPLSVAAAVVCLVALFAWQASRPPQVQPSDVLAQTLGREDSLRAHGGPVHQEFQIEIRQVKPAPLQRSGLIKVWYDSPGGRFAGRWEGEDGELQYAIWRPEPGREFVFNAHLGASAVPRAPQSGQPIALGELSFDEVSLEQLETGFLHWLSNRRWEPISIASDVNVFQRQDGVEAEVEMVTSDDGRQSYRITARRKTERGTVEVVAEVDAQTYKPSIELLRLSNSERVVELRLHSCRTQWLASGTIGKAVFWPSVEIAAEPEAVAELRPIAPRRIAEDPEPLEDSSEPAAGQLELLEVQARYALHQAGACLGVPIRVERFEERQVRIEGLVESDERKQDLLASLAGLSPPALVSIDIKTVEEALQTASDDASSGSSGGLPGQENTGPGARKRFEVVATDSPIREALEQYLRDAQGSSSGRNGAQEGPPLHDLASEFSERVISNSLANLTEAWALRRLAERYGGGNGSGLPQSGTVLLRRMLADHSSSLTARTAAIRQQVRPLLMTLADRSAPQADDSNRGAAPDHPAERDWAAQSLRIFQEIESTEAATTGLFADSGYANGARREASSERAASALLQALPRLESRLRSLEEYLNGQDGKSPQTELFVEGRPSRGLR